MTSPLLLGDSSVQDTTEYNYKIVFHFCFSCYSLDSFQFLHVIPQRNTDCIIVINLKLCNILLEKITFLHNVPTLPPPPPPPFIRLRYFLYQKNI